MKIPTDLDPKPPPPPPSKNSGPEPPPPLKEFLDPPLALYGIRHTYLHKHIQSGLSYPNSLVPIKICLDCETSGLLIHYKQKVVEDVTKGVSGFLRQTE